ncbi:MAG: ribosome biogenesis GTPase Der [Paludibacteraceae bacterium]|nr:ribosome biogenesis GTPase Der [Paludibacteraceae bacterium]
MANILAIVGRPNVGKSTLFNRLTKTRRAIVSDQAGTTRDRQYGRSEWLGKEFSVIDTGGWVVNSDDIFEGEINRQVNLAIREADVVLLVVDVNEGVTQFDTEVAHLLRQAKKPVVLAVNKVDTFTDQYAAAEFYKLGLGDPFILSAMNGLGTGELLDEIMKKFPDKASDEPEDELPRFAIVGRPNAGKSSLLNALIGEERTVVTEIAGTTRDSIYTRYNKFGKDFYLVDTAGIRKKAKVTEDLEYYSVVRSIRAIENADVCILMIDATRCFDERNYFVGMAAQDLSIFSIIQKNKKGLVVCVNKWDLVESKTTADIKQFEGAIRERLAPFTDFPIIFTSAVTKQRIFKVMETALHVFENKQRKVPTAKLNEYFLPLIENYPPPATKGKYIKIKYCTQLPDTQVPSFVFFANLPQYVKEPYRRFLENKLRANWDFNGTPVNLFIRQK